MVVRWMGHLGWVPEQVDVQWPCPSRGSSRSSSRRRSSSQPKGTAWHAVSML